MDAGVSPARSDDGHMRLHQSCESVFERALHSSLGRLSLPPGKGLAIILNDQLEGAA